MSDVIEEMKTEWRLRYKRDLTPNELANQFALMPMETRIAHLKRVNAPQAMSTREAGDRLAMERALHRTHETLRKVGR
jgi:hypothetical protein